MRPFKESGVFYGWWMVAASFVIATYVGGFVFLGFTAIFEPIADELDWSYTQVSVAASIRILVLGLSAPIVGMFVDRLGPRKIIAMGALLIAAGLFMLSHTYSLAMFYGAFVFTSLGMSFCTIVVLVTAVSNWFESRVGFASGIVLSGFGFGGILIPVIVRMIEAYDWRLSILYLAIGTLVIVLPLSLLFRHKPEHYNMLPDGKRKERTTDYDIPNALTALKRDFSARKALASRTFWHITLASACFAMMVMTVNTHIMPYLSSVGLDRSLSGIIASIIPLVSIFGRLGFGWLGDRHGRIMIAAIAFGMMSMGAIFLGFNSNSSLWVIGIFVLLFGIGWGAIAVLRTSLLREFFGRSNFGAILGLVEGISLIGSLAGPPLAGWVFDEFGSYKYIWFSFTGVMLVAVFLIIAIHRRSVNDDTSFPNHK
jgi:MFS family permease